MTHPSVFPSRSFPVEYWPLEYWPVSTFIGAYGCATLSDLFNSDVIIVDRSVSGAMLSDMSSSETSVSDLLCPN